MLGFSFEKFEGFTTEDFSAFEEHKWSSNRFNLERMRARARMDALAKDVGQRLGDKIGELSFRTTLDHPHIFNHNKVKYCWAWLDRPAEEKAELTRLVEKELALKTRVQDDIQQHHFATAGIGIDAQGAQVFFRLHANAALDRKNLLARVADPLEVRQFHALLSGLPGSVQVSISGEQGPRPASLDDTTALVRGLESFKDWFCIQQLFPADDPLLSSPDFPATAGALLETLLKVWTFASWTRDNDRLKLARAMKEEKKFKARKQSGLEPGNNVYVTSGLLAGKTGTVIDIDHRGRIKVQLGRITIDMDQKLLRKQ